MSEARNGVDVPKTPDFADGSDYSDPRLFAWRIASDECGVIRLRTNHRKNEEVYLFRTTVKPAPYEIHF